jgi:hypothetical protein
VIDRILRAGGRYATAAVGAVYAFTVGMVSARNRRLVYSIADHFRGTKHIAPAIPEISFNEATAGSGPVEILEAMVAAGNASPLELIAMAKLVRKHQPHKILEIGTFDGRTTLNLAANAPDDAKVYTLDLPREQMDEAALTLLETDRTHVDKDASGLRFHGTAHGEKITQLFGDSATFDFGPYAGQIDFMFVDGAHSYEYVIADTKTALKLTSGRNAVILWHDYGGVYDFAGVDDVTRALNELYATMPELKGCRRIEGTTIAILVRQG